MVSSSIKQGYDSRLYWDSLRSTSMSKYELGWVLLARTIYSFMWIPHQGMDLNGFEIDVLMPNGKDNPWNAICLEKFLPKI